MKESVRLLLKDRGRTLPVISFPLAEELGRNISDFVSSSAVQAEEMIYLARNYPVGAVFNMMDLSVEAQAFGADVDIEKNKIPEVKGSLLRDISEARELAVPGVTAGRCPVFIAGIRLAKEKITDVPVFCGVIGPYSLACRLFGMTELMMECFDSPADVEILLRRCTEFIVNYILALRQAGADGVLLCEPAAGLLSPGMAEEFSFPFVKEIFDKVSSDSFITAYHNCGASVSRMGELLGELKADLYHFGNAVDMKELIPYLPADSIVSGNLDPLLLKTGSREKVFAAVEEIYSEFGSLPNFILSTGCDVPPDAGIESIKAFFEAAGKYSGR